MSRSPPAPLHPDVCVVERFVCLCRVWQTQAARFLHEGQTEICKKRMGRLQCAADVAAESPKNGKRMSLFQSSDDGHFQRSVKRCTVTEETENGCSIADA
jgi:hypothetical protein